MYFFIKKKSDDNWTDISKNINLPITILDTKDGKISQSKIVARFNPSFVLYDITKPTPPDLDFKITEVNDLDLETELNTFWFKTDGGNNVRKRKEVIDQNGNVVMDELWEHIFIVKDYITKLSDSTMPNYTITQPKSQFFDVFRRSRGANFELGQKFEQDGLPKTLYKGNKNYMNEFRYKKNGLDMIDIDYANGKHYVELNDIDELSYSVKLSMFLNKSAPSIFTTKFLWETTRKLHAYSVSEAELSNVSIFDLKATVYYYQGNNVIGYNSKIYKINSSGSKVIVKDFSMLGNNSKITGFDSPPQENETYINVESNPLATKAVVEFEISNTREELNSFNLDHSFSEIEYDDGNLKTYNVVCLMNSININVTSSSSSVELEEDFITYYDFLEKALFDYNANRRDKITLSEDLKTILSEPAKESEWVDFTFKELVERLFKYVGITPTLTFDDVLGYVIEKNVSVDFNIQLQQSVEKEQIGADFYDKIVSHSKNLVSEQDIIKDVVLISSSESEFAQMGSENLGFILGTDIYYISNGVVHIPGLEFDFTTWGAGIINTNTNKPYHWDITTRLFEEDIYNSFPNVRYDTKEGGRAYKDNYSKGNTLYYKSGDKYVKGLGNLAESIPDFNMFTVTPILNVAEYALIETLIVLAISQIPDEAIALETAKGYSENFTLQDFNYQDIVLELEYAPIYKELTTKYVSNMSERRGLHKEHKVNMNNKTVSYQESEQVLRVEMERKGNVKEVYEENYLSLEELVPNLSVVGDNLYVTSKLITIDKRIITVEYTLQENFILQNDDIRLGVEFERYNIPYEFVNREVFIENHLMFNNNNTSRYSKDEKGANKNLIDRILVANNNEDYKLSNPIYTKTNINTGYDTDLEVFTRVGMLENKFSMILSGSFMDNYTAGIQRYTGSLSNERLLFSQPMAYTDTKGKFKNITNFKLGWNINTGESSRLGGLSHLKTFPDASSINLNYTLYEKENELVLNKDARERISFNHTSFLESENENIKWYSFKPIKEIGALQRSINYIDDLDIEDIDYQLYEDRILGIDVEDIGNNIFEVRVELDELYEEDFPNGIIFISEKGNKRHLTGLLKNALFEDNKIKFYIATTRYGYWEKQTVRLTLNQKIYVDSHIDYRMLLNTSGQLDVNLKLSLSSYISKELIDGYGVTYLLDKDIITSTSIDLELNDYGNITDGLDFSLRLTSGINMVMKERSNVTNSLDFSLRFTSDINLVMKDGLKSTTSLESTIKINSLIDFLTAEYYNTNKTIEPSIKVLSNINYEFKEGIAAPKLLEQNIKVSSNINYEFKEGIAIQKVIDQNIKVSTLINRSLIDNPAPAILRWAYKGLSSQPICRTVGYNPIGTTCSIENEVMVASGTDINKSGDCHELICKKV